MDLKDKAILIERPSQLRTFRKLCSENNIECIKQDFSTPFYFMLFQTACGWYAIPNTALDHDEFSISAYNFLVLSLNQFKEKLIKGNQKSATERKGDKHHDN